jgi:hypothetical protein
MTPLLVQALLSYVLTADDLDAGTWYIVDGTLLPCWSWRAHAELTKSWKIMHRRA